MCLDKSRQNTSLLRSRSGRSHVTLPVPTRLLQTDIHSFLGVLRFCLLGPMSLSFSCHCIRCTNHRREHSQQNESHTLIGLFPRKECISVWSSRVGTGSVTWLRPERLRRRLAKHGCDVLGLFVFLRNIFFEAIDYFFPCLHHLKTSGAARILQTE